MALASLLPPFVVFFVTIISAMSIELLDIGAQVHLLHQIK